MNANECYFEIIYAVQVVKGNFWSRNLSSNNINGYKLKTKKNSSSSWKFLVTVKWNNFFKRLFIHHRKCSTETSKSLIKIIFRAVR